MQTFIDTYTSLNKDNLELLGKIYSNDIVFKDPAHEIHGLVNLKRYFESLYTNCNSVVFSFSHHQLVENDGFIQWEMSFSHPKLRSGKIIAVPGVSRIHFNNHGKVDYHRDFFDLGGMLYEHIPLLGRIISAVKRRLGS